MLFFFFCTAITSPSNTENWNKKPSPSLAIISKRGACFSIRQKKHNSVRTHTLDPHGDMLFLSFYKKWLSTQKKKYDGTLITPVHMCI